MSLSFYYSIATWILSIVQFMLMLICIHSGRVVAKGRVKSYSDNPGNSVITTSLYGLLGLLMAFTFSSSADRFKERKQIIITESDHIGTAILRIQLYADSVQPEMKKHFRSYIQARINYYDANRDTVKIKMAMDEANHYADSLWKIVARQSKMNGNLIASNQMIPVLNNVFDIANMRFWGEYERTPPSILTMLFFLSMCIAFLVGYTSVGKGKFDWAMAISFCLLTCLVVFFIIDLDKPRMGIITLDEQEQAIIDLLKMTE